MFTFIFLRVEILPPFFPGICQVSHDFLVGKVGGAKCWLQVKRARTALAATLTETPPARAWHLTAHSVTTSWQTGDAAVGGTDRPLCRFSGSIFQVTSDTADTRVDVTVSAPSPAVVGLLCPCRADGHVQGQVWAGLVARTSRWLCFAYSSSLPQVLCPSLVLARSVKLVGLIAGLG